MSSFLKAYQFRIADVRLFGFLSVLCIVSLQSLVNQKTYYPQLKIPMNYHIDHHTPQLYH